MNVGGRGEVGDGHVVVVDLGYGDAGKGTIVDWLCATRSVHTVVRFNGGAQAGHNVVTVDGRHHTFAQFGSGTFHGARTHLARFCVVDPLALAAEAEHLDWLGVVDPLGLVTAEGGALLATPYHRAANRARELARGGDRHGSCGMGVGEAMAYALTHPADAPRVADCATPRILAGKLETLRDRLLADLARLTVDGPGQLTVDGEVADGLRRMADDVPPVEDCVAAFHAFGQRISVVDDGYLAAVLRSQPVVFEGAQGVLLDEWHGFHPYTTWSTTTFENAERLLAGATGPEATGPEATGPEATGVETAASPGASRIAATRLGVVRVTTTRHGPGPLVTEDSALTAALPDRHNPANRWQGGFRVGHFDEVAHRYAVEVAGGVDAIALTHLDVAERAAGLRWCRAYREEHCEVPRIPVDPDVPLDPAAPAAIARLDRMARLTGRLLQTRPTLVPAPRGRDGWSSAVADALGAPVVVTSSGPTAADKRS